MANSYDPRNRGDKGCGISMSNPSEGGIGLVKPPSVLGERRNCLLQLLHYKLIFAFAFFTPVWRILF